MTTGKLAWSESGVGARRVWRLRGARVVRGVLHPSGDKSLAHRVWILAALSRGTSILRGVPDGEDVARTRAALAALGVRIAPRGAGAWRVEGVGLYGLRPPRLRLDCGNSGTTMRLLAGLLSVQPFESRLSGDASLRRRPMQRVATPLRALGGRVICRGRNGRPPLVVGGVDAVPPGGRVSLPIDSAQVRSALLLAGLYARGATTIAPQSASRDHTQRLLRSLGVRVRDGARGTVLHPRREGWRAFRGRIPGDVSSAAFWIALAAATPGSHLRVRGVALNPGRIRFLEVLCDAGARIHVRRQGTVLGEPWGSIEVRGGALRAMTLRGRDVVQCLDEIPALAAAAACAGSALQVRDARELRVKESDRIAGIASVLTAFGARVRTAATGFTLAPGTILRPARVASRGDHRLAMAAAMCALRAPGTSHITGVDCVATSYPGFGDDARRLAGRAAKRVS
jgi:3-phosphoshikimate 1-carboxyvinyltransferase